MFVAHLEAEILSLKWENGKIFTTLWIWAAIGVEVEICLFYKELTWAWHELFILDVTGMSLCQQEMAPDKSVWISSVFCMVWIWFICMVCLSFVWRERGFLYDMHMYVWFHAVCDLVWLFECSLGVWFTKSYVYLYSLPRYSGRSALALLSFGPPLIWSWISQIVILENPFFD